MSMFTPVAEDVEVTVKSRDRSRWTELYNALTANPNVWLAVPEDQAADVRKAGKNSVQSKLDADEGQGGTVTIGETPDGKTVIRYAPATPLAKSTKATKDDKAERGLFK